MPSFPVCLHEKKYPLIDCHTWKIILMYYEIIDKSIRYQMIHKTPFHFNEKDVDVHEIENLNSEYFNQDSE